MAAVPSEPVPAPTAFMNVPQIFRNLGMGWGAPRPVDPVKIEQLQAIFPHLSAVDAERHLRDHNSDVQRVVNHVLAA